jgi:hypothetical protein
MNTRHILAAITLAAAVLPLSAHADISDRDSQQWLNSLMSTLTRDEVRASIGEFRHYGEADVITWADPKAPGRTRAEVKAELAKYGSVKIDA